MKSVSSVEGPMLQLPPANIDTDQIIPNHSLKAVILTCLAPNLFYDWAHDDEGEREM